jgi:hypothetical protein
VWDTLQFSVSVSRLRQFLKQLLVQAMARLADLASCHRILHVTTRFVAVRAVVKAALTGMLAQVGHQAREGGGLQMMQAKGLKAR